MCVHVLVPPLSESTEVDQESDGRGEQRETDYNEIDTEAEIHLSNSHPYSRPSGGSGG